MFLANQVVRVDISRPSRYASALSRLECFDNNAHSQYLKPVPFLGAVLCYPELHFIVC